MVNTEQGRLLPGRPRARRLPIRHRGVFLPLRHPALAARRRHRSQLCPLLRLAHQENEQAAQELQAHDLEGAKDVQETHGHRPLKAAPPHRAR